MEAGYIRDSTNLFSLNRKTHIKLVVIQPSPSEVSLLFELDFNLINLITPLTKSSTNSGFPLSLESYIYDV